MSNTYTLGQLAERLGAQLIGDDAVVVNGVATLQAAAEGDVAFLSNSKYRKFLLETQATAVLLSEDEAEHCKTNALVHENPYVAFAKLAQLLDDSPRIANGIHPTAIISDTASLGEGVSVGPNVVIEEGVVIGANSQIGAGSFIGQFSEIGEQAVIYPNTTIYHHTVLGTHCVVQSQSVLGGNGFGYANDKGTWVKIPQTGRLVVGNHVEIGASTCIDRGALDDTVISDNVIIDNNVQIGHNTKVGYGSCICGNVGIAGSANIGKHVVIGGGCGVNGHITIVDGVQITGFSMITKDLLEPGVYSSGQPATPNKEWRRNAVRLKQIDTLYARVKTLESQLADSEKDS